MELSKIFLRAGEKLVSLQHRAISNQGKVKAFHAENLRTLLSLNSTSLREGMTCTSVFNCHDFGIVVERVISL